MGGLDLGGHGRPRGPGGAAESIEDGTVEPGPEAGDAAVSNYAGPVQDLIDELGRLPGVGPKSAQRIAFHLLKLPRDDALRLAGAIVEVKDKVTFCTALLQHRRGRRVRHLHRRPPRHHGDLRGRGAPRHRVGREDR